MLFRRATLADDRVRDVRVRDEAIEAVTTGLKAESDEIVIDADDYHLLPGAIDAHVHFRVPGYPHKEDWRTGSRAAARGGVTTVIDQPNTDPPTVTGVAFDRKEELTGDSLVDYGLNGGVTPEWNPEELFDRPICALGEVFLADSTGDMGIGTELFRRATERAASTGLPITVHAEDADLFNRNITSQSATDVDAWSAYRPPESEIAAIEQALEVGTDAHATLHLAHVSTPEGIDAVAGTDATCEVTPHHLLLSREDLPELGTFGRMNPPLRSERRREGVVQRVQDGTVDLIATDHAPHVRAEKETTVWEAPSGVPGVETLVPLLLTEVQNGRLPLERVRDLVARNPANLLNLRRKGRIAEGFDADLVLVNLDASREIRASELHSKAGWTPYEGRRGVFPLLTTVRGRVVHDARDSTVSFGESIGGNVRTART